MISGEKTSEFSFLGWTFIEENLISAEWKKKNLTLHLRIRNHGVLKTSKRKLLYNRPRRMLEKKKDLKSCFHGDELKSGF